MSRLLAALAVVFFVAGNACGQIQWKTLDYPGAVSTQLTGISGNDIVGIAVVDNGGIGISFLYNGSSFTTLVDPQAAPYSTFASGIDGSNIVGYYFDAAHNWRGFLYNGTTWTTLNDPLATEGTVPNGISGSNIVGSYFTATSTTHGFIYNGSSYTTIDDPLATGEMLPNGVSGSNVVGYYFNATGAHGFIYNGSSYTTLDDPLATPSVGGDTCPWGIWQNEIVGSYGTINNYGFLYDGTSFTTLDYPGASDTLIFGIDGNKLVGCYRLSNYSDSQGFIAIVPEPSTIGLLAVAATCLAAFHWQRQHKVE